eukprot:scaffold1638_cov258-Pinguiococcus_pyrenoidosus.AAC.34
MGARPASALLASRWPAKTARIFGRTFCRLLKPRNLVFRRDSGASRETSFAPSSAAVAIPKSRNAGVALFRRPRMRLLACGLKIRKYVSFSHERSPAPTRFETCLDRFRNQWAVVDAGVPAATRRLVPAYLRVRRVALQIKRMRPAEQDVYEATDGPHVHGMVPLPVLDHFRGPVGDGAS